ncbi:class I SAM-dependent methyltransferase [Aquabacter sp. CN5-332]|uniref:class I SAM-dependent methyltransferase n=1 Tax=Aquabacter sp. CN5-332 TaxID=3156608 RepID=UPI0032B51D92
MTAVSLIDYAQGAGETQSKPESYLNIYERYFSHMRDDAVTILELGVATGKSMLMWSDYFSKGTIVGIDLFPPGSEMPTMPRNENRIHMYRGAQNDTEFLSRVSNEIAPNGFDIIIDDAAHIGELAKVSFSHLFLKHLKPGGIYGLEDWGTGYWQGHAYYPDGRRFKEPGDGRTFLHQIANKALKNAPVEWPSLTWMQKLLKPYQYVSRFRSHEYGMPGVIKQLIDEVARSDWSSLPYGTEPKEKRPSYIESILISPGVTLVTKSRSAPMG